MKKIGLFVAMMFALVIFGAATASANIHVFHPNPPDLNDLVHQSYYTWGINWAPYTNEVITGAVLTYKGIYDWTYERDDSLYTHLLDNPQLGVRSFFDNEGGLDNFQGVGKWVGTWSDPFGDWNHRINLSYNLGSLGLINDLNAYAANGVFGFGIDPDCHYYNCGIELCVTSSVIPEPATLSLLGLGLAGAGMFFRRKR